MQLLNTKMRTVPAVTFCRHCYIYTVTTAGERCGICRDKQANLAEIENQQMRLRVVAVGAVLGAACLIVFVAALIKGI